MNALWNLAPHDISICLYWYGETPNDVSCHGVRCFRDDIDDVCFLNMAFPSGRFAHIHVSWLDPLKTRKMTVVGRKKMLVYDDTSSDAKVVIYDKGVDFIQEVEHLSEFENFSDFQAALRTGDTWIPRFSFREPLQVEAKQFVKSIREGTPSPTDAVHGLEVVRVLEAGTNGRGLRPAPGQFSTSPV